jgi:hypothetical protein
MQTTGEFLVSVRDFRATVSATKPIYIKGNFDNFKTFKTGSVRGTDVVRHSGEIPRGFLLDV